MNAISLLLATTIAAAGAPAPAASGDPTALLLESARLWEARGRSDLARVALEKLLAAEPGHPQASILLGDLEARSGEIEKAEAVLAELRARHPGDPAATELANALRLQTRDRMRVVTVRRLVEMQKFDEAATMMRELFPDGPPPGPQGIEYWTTIARSRNGLAPAVKGLEQLMYEHPQDARYRIALAGLLARHPGTRTRGFRMLNGLARDPAVDREAVLSAWRTGLAYLPKQAENLPQMQAFLRYAPNDREVRGYVASARANERERQRRLNDPVIRLVDRAAAARADGWLDDAEAALAQASAMRADDPDVLGGYGWLRMRQGRREEADAFFARAAQRDRGQARRWQRARATALGWSLYAEASALRDAGQLDEAEARSEQARRQLGDIPEIQAQRASIIALRPGGAAEAETLYRQLLAKRPGDGTAMRGLVGLLTAQGRDDEALHLVENVAGKAAAQNEGYAQVHASLLRARAQRELDARQLRPALDDLEQALALAPRDPWLRFDLARLYQQLSLPDEARALVAEGVELSPDDPAMRYASALILAGLDAPSDALALLEPIAPDARDDAIRDLDQRLRLTLARDRAIALNDAGQHDEAVAELEVATALAGDDVGRLTSLGHAWMSIGEPARGLAGLRVIAARDDTSDTQLSWAGLLARDDDDAEAEKALREVLAALDARALDPAQRQRRDQLATSLALRDAAVLRREGRPRQAWDALAPALAMAADQPDVIAEQARVLTALGRRDDANALYTKALERQPQNMELQGDWIAWLLDDDRIATARPLVAQMRAQSPDAPETRLAEARFARARHHPDEAMAIYQALRAEEIESHYSGYSAARAGIASIEGARNGYVTAGTMFYDKSGAAGISRYTAKQLSVEAHVPYRYAGSFFAVADAVTVDAGRLPADFARAREYGSVAAAGAGVIAQFPSGAVQDASGVDLGVGWQDDRLRIDIGSTPLDFPVVNVVGGLRWDDRSADWGYGVELSRRPVTGSLLSYAGVVDPASGRTWGGVVASGVTARASYAPLDLWMSVNLRQLDGRGVADNNSASLHTGVDHSLLRRGGQRLDTGLVLQAQHYAKDLGHYTLGHGGYYSPQRLLSVTLPLEWQGRLDRFSWRLRAAFSLTATRRDEQDWYPRDAALQAAAGDPVYAGSNGTGTGFSLRSAAEYRVARDWSLGATIDLDRSEYYTPNTFGLYLRYRYTGDRDRFDIFPRPPQPYADY